MILASFTLSLASFVMMGLIWAWLKRSESKIRKTLLSIELQKTWTDKKMPRLTITNEGEQIVIRNIGEGSAEDICLMVGLTPNATKQKIRAVESLAAGERARIILPPSLDDDPLNAYLSYCSEGNGHVFRDEFLLKFDRNNFQMLTLAQAS